MKEYVNKFNQLARFGMELVSTPHEKALRFAKGLNEPLHGLAMSHIPMGATFENLVDMALIHEEEKGANVDKAQDKKGDPKKAQQQQKKGGKDDKARDKRKCHNCGGEGHLIKDCKRNKNACFNCGEVRYFSREFSKKQGQGQGVGSSCNTPPPPGPHSRVLALALGVCCLGKHA